ncbi:MAG: Ig-like domain-containing protein [Sphingomonas sp.]|jgi:YD repeat-containing protein|uniref:Ig-like domain-containing protein n=1 Tax=Sphingomonas sp. TaxID=28214 RepID=UPI0035654955
MRRSHWLLVSASALGVLAGWRAAAQETTSYSYDALGRLVTTVRSGGPNNGVAMATCFDPAGNRTNYAVNTNGVASCSTPTPSPTPTPTPTPTSSNQPPIAVADSVSIPCWTTGTANLTANDSDPENNVPLALQSITRTSGTATATVSSASTVSINANDKGASIFSYSVADSLGAISTGQLTVTSTGGTAYCANYNGGG